MPRPDELPEGTDHIINGAMATDTDDSGRDDGGFVAPGAIGDDTGGTVRGTGVSGGGTAMSSSNTGGAGAMDRGGGGGETTGIREQFSDQVQALRGQAGDRVREFADSGKTRASDALEELSRIVSDTADTIDERMGGQYGEYARKASDAVSGFAGTLRKTEVDELYGNVRDAVRKSPGIALGVAAVVGFTLARLAKAGLDAQGTAGNAGGTSSGGASSGGKPAGGTSGSTGA